MCYHLPDLNTFENTIWRCMKICQFHYIYRNHSTAIKRVASKCLHFKVKYNDLLVSKVHALGLFIDDNCIAATTIKT